MDTLLKKAIENQLVRKPSQGFSDKIMSQLFEMKVQVSSQPLIPVKIWIGTVVTVAAILGVSVLAKPQDTLSKNFDFFTKIENFVSAIKLPKIDFFANINLLIISGICLALFLLLFFDLVIFRKK